MARIQIEYTANISELQANLDKIIEKNRLIASTAKEASVAMGKMAGAEKIAGIRNLNTQLQQLHRQTTGLNSTMSTLSSNMSRVSTASQSARTSVNSLASALSSIRGYVAGAFAVGSILEFGKEIIRVNAQMELLQSRFAFIYGSQTVGAAAFDRITKSVKQLGLSFQSTMEQAAAFSIAATQVGYTSIEAERMFTKFAGALRGAGVGNLQVQRSFYALQQMMSKGVVSAEELNRQMGESLPGAAYLMFKAYKQLHPEQVQVFEDFRKLQKEGKILTDEVIGPFIDLVYNEFSPAIAGKSNSLSASMERATTSWVQFKDALLDTGPVKESFNTISNSLDNITKTIESETMPRILKVYGVIVQMQAPFRKLLGDIIGFKLPKTIEERLLESGLEKEAKTQDAMAERFLKVQLQATNKFKELDDKKKTQVYEALSAEISLYKEYYRDRLAMQEKFDKLSDEQIDEKMRIKYPGGVPQIGGFERFGTKTLEDAKTKLDVAESLLLDYERILTKTSPKGEDDTKDKGKVEDPRVKAIQDQINAIKALMIQEENRMKNFNQNSSFEQTTSQLLLNLTIALAKKTEELANLKKEGAGADALAAAEAQKAALEAQIKLTNELLNLEVHKLQIEKTIIEEKIATVTEGSIEEYKLKEELMNKTAEIEKKKARNSAETIKKITEENNAAIKKMYEDLFKETNAFLNKLDKFVTEPFMTEKEIEIQGIKDAAQAVREETSTRFRLGVLYPDQKAGGAAAFGNAKINKRFFDDLEKINKAERELIRKATGEEEKGLFGLSPDELKKLKKIVDEALNIFSDYYAARTEIAKNALEKEQALLDKKFEAGLIRENEYNEETKKNKEEMAKLDRDAARFGVLINTAQAIVKLYTDFDAITATILAAGVVAVGATQLSAINSAPLPEFHEGGLDIKKSDNKRQNKGLKSGEFYAKLLEGESVMTREQTAKYKDVLKAIREDSLPLQIMKGYTAPAYHRSMDEPYRMAKEQTSLELAFQNAELVEAIKRNGAVAIKNADELADAIVSKSSYTKITNRRRIR